MMKICCTCGGRLNSTVVCLLFVWPIVGRLVVFLFFLLISCSIWLVSSILRDVTRARWLGALARYPVDVLASSSSHCHSVFLIAGRLCSSQLWCNHLHPEKSRSPEAASFSKQTFWILSNFASCNYLCLLNLRVSVCFSWKTVKEDP